MVQGNNRQGENENREILRHQRLEQRNNALASEFRDLKLEIGRAYNQLCNLVEKLQKQVAYREYRQVLRHYCPYLLSLYLLLVDYQYYTL